MLHGCCTQSALNLKKVLVNFGSNVQSSTIYIIIINTKTSNKAKIPGFLVSLSYLAFGHQNHGSFYSKFGKKFGEIFPTQFMASVLHLYKV